MAFRTPVAAKLLSGVGAFSFACALLSAAAPPSAYGKDPDVSRIGHIIVIFQENWSFDSLYGLFPGADGLANSFGQIPQLDVTANPAYSALIYQTPSPLAGFPPAADPQFPAANGKLGSQVNPHLPLPLVPYDFTDFIPVDSLTDDIVHRFYHEQLQIDNGALETKNGDLDKFVTWSDNPGLVLSYIDATTLPEGLLAQQYTLCDKFFHSAYGGSFLNHRWLIAAQTPP
jgi:phospholipase C